MRHSPQLARQRGVDPSARQPADEGLEPVGVRVVRVVDDDVRAALVRVRDVLEHEGIDAEAADLLGRVDRDDDDLGPLRRVPAGARDRGPSPHDDLE